MEEKVKEGKGRDEKEERAVVRREREGGTEGWSKDER